MSNSNFCLEQRRLQQQHSNKILGLGLGLSVVVHATFIPFVMKSFQKAQITDEPSKPIELIIVEQPTPAVPKSLPVVPPLPINKTRQPVKPQRTNVVPLAKPKAQAIPQAITPKPTQQAIAKPKSVLTTPSESGHFSSPSGENTPPNNAPVTGQPTTNVDNSSTSTSGGTSGPIGANNVPAPPKVQQGSRGISCLSNCQPSYPSVLKGAEGKATVDLQIDPNGNVVSVTLVGANSNTQLNRQALLAARKMKFTPPAEGNMVSVKVAIHFTVAGSGFDRIARERQQQEQEKKRLAREAQLQRERQEQELQTQQQQSPQPSVPQPQLEQKPSTQIESPKPQEPLKPLIPRNAPLLPNVQQQVGN